MSSQRSAPAADAAATPAATTFDELGVPAPIVAALARLGLVTPFPIQSASLSSSMSGRDVLGRGRTGSGKTVAFAVPVVTTLSASGRQTRPGHPRALILVPTRELAAQVAAAVEPLAASMGQRVTTIYGGVGQGPQVAALKRGVDIVVACPGRLEDLIGQRHCQLDAVEVCVLDEADHLADLGFLPVVKKLLDRTPASGQRLLFSATLDRGVDAVVRRYLRNPVTHSVDEVDAPPPMLEHHAFTVEPGHKAAVVRELASGADRSLLFTRTKHAAKKLARQLATDGVPAVDLHGNLSQPQRLRNLAAFADGSVRVLVATDIAARGIHVDDIALVVHVDPPSEHKAYLHRSGRTARAGAAGVVVTVATPAQEGEMRALVRLAGIRPTASRIGPGDPRTLALTGPAAPPRFLAVPAPAPTQSNRPSRSPRPSASPARSRGRRR
ncbi:MAG: DEAD/DEAH box helicase [Acidimicrobiales bacterium]